MAKNIVKKPKVAKGEEVWVSFSQADYKEGMNNLVHLSAKAVNSNAQAGGVRLSRTLDLPYFAVSTVVLKKINLDYMKNSGKIAKVAKQINSVLNNNYQSIFLAAPAQEVDWINNLYVTLGYADLLGEVDCHIKQVLMHNGEEDVSLSPLHCAGLAELINITEKELLEIKNAPIKIKNINLKKSQQEKESIRLFGRVEMNFGGSNTQNLGSLIRQMQHPLFVMPPTENQQASKVFSIHYKGIKIENYSLIDQLLTITDGQHAKIASEKSLKMEDRVLIEKQLIKIVQDIKNRASEAFLLVQENKDLLPEDKNKTAVLFSSDITNNVLQAGLFFENLRSSAWRKELSYYLVQKICRRSRKIKDGNGNFKEVGSGISDDESKAFYSIIEHEVIK